MTTAFAVWLREQRARRGWSRATLAQAAAASAVAIQKLEAGDRNPSREMALALARALEVGADQSEAFVAFARGMGGPPALPGLPGRAPRLPASPNLFVGRQNELQLLTGYLRDPHTRLLTLIGPPGVGKTRLALEVARQHVQHRASDAVFVPLAALNEAELVARTIALALGIRDAGSDAVTAVVSALAGADILLILDNLEHLVAAGEDIAALLAGCAQVTILATSREPLRLSAERLFAVSPLRTDGDGAALSLFADRAARSRPDLVLDPAARAMAAEICDRLDGLPLAIELACAQLRNRDLRRLRYDLEAHDAGPMRVLRLGARDLPPRQQTLRAAIEWSVDMLDERSRQAYAALGVCWGGFDEDLALSIIGGSEPRSILESLLDKSLVQQDAGTGRCNMFETLREHAQTLLAASGQGERARDAHASVFVRRLAQTLSAHRSEGWAKAVLALAPERANLRTAFAWLAGRDPERAAAFAASASPVYEDLGDWRESVEQLRLCERIYPSPTPARGRVLSRLGWLEGKLQNIESALHWTQAARGLFAALGDERAAAGILQNEAELWGRKGDVTRGRALTEAALDQFVAFGDFAQQAYSLAELANYANNSGDWPTAEGYFARSIAAAKASGDPRQVAWNIAIWAEASTSSGDAALVRQALTDAAASMVALGDRPGLHFLRLVEGRVIELEAGPGPALVYITANITAGADTRAYTLRQVDHASRCLGKLGHHAPAVMLDAAVGALYPELRHIQTPVELDDRQVQLSAAEAALGADATARARSAGAALRFDEVVALLEAASPDKAHAPK